MPLRKNMFDFFRDGHNQQPFTYKKQFGANFSKLVQLHQNFANLKYRRQLFDLCRYPISSFFLIIELTCSEEVSIENFTL